MTFVCFLHPTLFASICIVVFVVGYSSDKVEDVLYDWTTASGKCTLAGSEITLRGEDSDEVPNDGRTYWVGAIQKYTELFKMGDCNTYNDPKSVLFRMAIINSTHPVLDCYQACAKFRAFALSSDTCFCKTQPDNETRHRCTPVQFRQGSIDFHGGSNGAVEYDKLITPVKFVQDINQDDFGDCVSCEQFSEDCVKYRLTPCFRKQVYKCGFNFVTDGVPWWDSITSCNGSNGAVDSVPNRTAVWTRISRRSHIVWTNSFGSSLDGIRVRCLSVAKTDNTIFLFPQDCLTNLPSLCQDKTNFILRPLPVDLHDDTTVPLAVVFVLACLTSVGLLGTTIYFRRQRNAEIKRRLEETYVNPNFVQLEPEDHQYSSLQYIAHPPRQIDIPANQL